MEVKNKNTGLKVLVVILILLVLGLAGYIVADKFILNNKQENKATNEVVNKEETDKLYQTLTVGNKQYGLYFKNNVNINSIDDDKIVLYAVVKFLENKGWMTSLKTDLQCVTNPEENQDRCGGPEIPKAKETEINDLIKGLFNTNKTFTINKEDIKFLGKESSAYVLKDGNYYFGYIPSSGLNRQIFNSFIRSEETKDTIYIYDKAFVYESDGSGGLLLKDAIDGESIAVGHDVLSKYITDSVNSDLIFKDFESKINTYKHTFKKASDGNYYWQSSEIVK